MYHNTKEKKRTNTIQVIVHATSTVVWLVSFGGTYDFAEATTFKGYLLRRGGLLLRDRDRPRVPLMFLFKLVYTSSSLSIQIVKSIMVIGLSGDNSVCNHTID